MEGCRVLLNNERSSGGLRGPIMDIFNYIFTAHMKVFIDCHPPELYKIYQ